MMQGSSEVMSTTGTGNDVFLSSVEEGEPQQMFWTIAIPKKVPRC